MLYTNVNTLNVLSTLSSTPPPIFFFFCLYFFLISTMCVSAQSHPTLYDPYGCSLPGSSVHGILQARILEWVSMPSSSDLPDPRMEPASLMSPTLAGGFFTTNTTWKALCVPINMFNSAFVFKMLSLLQLHIQYYFFLTIKSTPIIMFIYTICCHLRLPVKKNFHKHKRTSKCQ